MDETGQDTKGRFFLVSVIVVEKEREQLRDRLKRIEKETKKKSKWIKTKIKTREAYIQKLIETKILKDKIFFAQFSQSKEYLRLTVYAVAKAILSQAKEEYRATVWVDGLSRKGRKKFAKGLRELKIKLRKVRGIRKEESDVFIRLADAIAGFVRDYLEKDKYAQTLYRKAKRQGIIKEI